MGRSRPGGLGFRRAQALEVGLSAGFGNTVNDPFVNRRFVRADVEYLLDFVGAEVSLLYSPDLGDSDWTPLAKQLVNDYKISPDISKITSAVLVQGKVLARDGRAGSARVTTGLGVGVGLVSTSDDLVALGDNSESAMATAEQEHLAWTMSLQSEATWGGIGIRLRMDRVTYTEVIATETEEKKSPVCLSLGLLLRG